ncbi:MAG TPA: peroxidase family protein [Actinomycetales bacterium]|nr:peroxidase family protein [Actinomycetales bacterium]
MHRAGKRFLALGVALLLSAGVLPAGPTSAQAAAPVGQGFTVTPADLAFILKQIKIAEAHVANTTSATGPCGALLGSGPNQVPNPLLSFGLRTVDGSCNNLQPGRSTFGSSDQRFPRLADPVFKSAEVPGPFGAPGAPATSYDSIGNVVDSQPRIASNLIVDQTSTNPAAVAAAGLPVRSQNNPGVFPCTTDPDPLATPAVEGVPTGCTPKHQTLFVPNVTTDVGLSPPYNSLFTLFGQFFDHGLDLVGKSGGTVFVPLKADDPLVAGPDHVFGNGDDLNPNLRFMVLTRATNRPGTDGVLGTADDEQNGTNRDSPFVDQSQTYTSHSSHQVFLREYADNSQGRPVSTGRLLGSADGGMATWKLAKQQASARLGMQLTDLDVLNIPMIAADPYGKFIPGPDRGLPQYVTSTGMVEGDREANGGLGVLPPPNVKRIDSAFLDDIAHSAVPAPGRTPDTDTGITPATSPQPAGTYDDEMLNTHFVAGDGRTNENIGLTAIHQIFHSEHDRLVADIKNTLTTDTSAAGVAALPEWKSALGAGGWNGERLFQAARFVTEMEYQHLVFEEFARKVQPAIEPFTVYHDNVNSAIQAEFAHAVYRFGHSMLTETISRQNADGSHNDIPLLDGFLNPPSYTRGGTAGTLTSEQAAGSIIMGMSDQVGNELDEFVTDTLRNNLLGLPLDLPTLNMARARETGVPPLNVLRRQLHASTNDAQLQPYTSWVDFGLGIKHPESLVNFVAAYGRHPTILSRPGPDGNVGTPDDEPATLASRRAAAQVLVDPPVGTDPGTVPADAAAFLNSTGAWANTAAGASRTGLDDVDLWMGGLAEKTNLFGGLLGSTFNYVFEKQMTDLQNGDRFYYLARTPGMNLRTELEGNSFAEMMMRNTDSHTLKADAFATADCKFQLGKLGGTPEVYDTSGATVADDPASECDETALLIRQPDGTIRYRTTNSVDPPGINGQGVYNGTANADRVTGGVDNDTFLGNQGRDRIEGQDGGDVAIGGEGDDIITDSAGDDVLKGGPGDDAIDAGPGLDIVMGGAGKDFTNGGANANETFGGDGDDMMIAGGGTDTIFGDGGDDWEEGGDGQDLMCGDSCAPFFDDPNAPGSDVLIGQNGEEDYDAEGGDDIMNADAGIERNAGAAGFDWSSYQYDPLPADTDLNLLLIGVPLPAVVFRDRYQEVEALSGADKDDILRGDDVVPIDVGGAGFSGNDFIDADSVARISGLGALLPSGATANGGRWGAGNILLGGAGSDLIEGRGADDIIDGDKYLHVRLSVRTNPASPATEIGTTDLMDKPYLPGSTTTLQQAVFNGTVDPANIVVVREILSSPASTTDFDTAVFSGPRADYDVNVGAGGTTVAHARGTQADGTDTLRGVERMTFSDGTIEVASLPTNTPATGTVTLSSTAPVEGAALTATRAFSDLDGVGAVTFTWQALTGVDEWTPVATGATFTPSDAQVGQPIRVVATFLDGDGVLESVTSAATVAVKNVNDPATGAPVLSDTAPRAGVRITAAVDSIADADGLTNATFRFQWQLSNAAGGFADIADATTAALTPTKAMAGRTLRVVVSFTDDHGTAEQRTSAASAPVSTAVPPGAPTLGAVTAGDRSVTLAWTAPANNGGSAITGYQIAIRTAGATVNTLNVSGSTLSRTVKNLVNGTTYTFEVSATNKVGTGPAATSAAVTPKAAPSVPTGVKAAAGNASAQVSWNASAANGSPLVRYEVEVTQGATVLPPVEVPAGTGRKVSTTVNGLTNGKPYRFRVRAVNGAATSAYSKQTPPVTPRLR